MIFLKVFTTLSLLLFSLTIIIDVQATEEVEKHKEKPRLAVVEKTEDVETVVTVSKIDKKTEDLDLLNLSIETSSFEESDHESAKKFKSEILPEMKTIAKTYGMKTLMEVLLSPQITDENRKKVQLAFKLAKEESATTTTPPAIFKKHSEVTANWEERSPGSMCQPTPSQHNYDFFEEYLDYFKRTYGLTPMMLSDHSFVYDEISENPLTGTITIVKPHRIEAKADGTIKSIYYGAEETEVDELLKRIGFVGDIISKTTMDHSGFLGRDKTLLSVSKTKEGESLGKGTKAIDTIIFKPFTVAQIKMKQRQAVAQSLMQAMEKSDTSKMEALEAILEDLPRELSLDKDKKAEEQNKILMAKTRETQSLAQKTLELWRDCGIDTEMKKYEILSFMIKNLLKNSESSDDVINFLQTAIITKNKASGNNLLSNAVLAGDKEMVELFLKHPILSKESILTNDELRWNVKNENARDLAKVAYFKIKKEQPTNSVEILKRLKILSMIDEVSSGLHFKDLEHSRDASPRDFTKMQALLTEISGFISKGKMSKPSEVEAALLSEIQKLIADEEKRREELLAKEKEERLKIETMKKELAAKEESERLEAKALQEKKLKEAEAKVNREKEEAALASERKKIKRTSSGAEFKKIEDPILGSNAFVDLQTGLVWGDAVTKLFGGVQTINYADAKRYCESLSDGKERNCRLPTIEEGKDLARKKAYEVLPHFAKKGHATRDSIYWTSTIITKDSYLKPENNVFDASDIDDSNHAWFQDNDNLVGVRCVCEFGRLKLK